MTILETQGLAARHAERVLAVAGTDQKNRALEAIAQALKERRAPSWPRTRRTWPPPGRTA